MYHALKHARTHARTHARARARTQGFSDAATAAKLEAKLKTAGCPLEFYMYERQGHGFMNGTDWGACVIVL